MPTLTGYTDIHIGLPMRRAILTELAEVRARREDRKKLLPRLTTTQALNLTAVELHTRDLRAARVEEDRKHIASLMRLLHTLRGDL